jgi:hypothetical protein
MVPEDSVKFGLGAVPYYIDYRHRMIFVQREKRTNQQVKRMNFLKSKVRVMHTCNCAFGWAPRLLIGVFKVEPAVLLRRLD